MKVGLDMARNPALLELPVSNLVWLPKWHRIVLFCMMVYVPGLVWKGKSTADFVPSRGFDMGSPIRHVIKLLHLCINHEELSENVLWNRGLPPSSRSSRISSVHVNFTNESQALHTIFSALRDNSANAGTTKYSFE